MKFDDSSQYEKVKEHYKRIIEYQNFMGMDSRATEDYYNRILHVMEVKSIDEIMEL